MALDKRQLRREIEKARREEFKSRRHLRELIAEHTRTERQARGYKAVPF